MSSIPRKNRVAFRPTLGDIRLEERVVLNGTSITSTALATPVTIIPIGNGSETGLGNFTMRQIRQASRQQLRASQTALRQFVNNQLAALNNDPTNFGGNGRLTQEALANFKANVAGALNATALQVSAQAALLPGSGRILPNLQNSLLGSRNNSLATRISNLIDSGRSTQSPTLFQNAINRQINRSFINNAARFANFFNSTPLNRLSINPTTGQRVPLSQFMANQAINQINNSFGTLANSVGPNAQAALFDATGAFNPQAVTAFQQQFANALGTAAFQIGNILSLFPNALTTLGPQLQSALFATGIDPLTGLPTTSFTNGLSSVFPSGTGTTPFTPAAFNTAFQNAFTPAFQGLTTPLSTFLGIQPTPSTGGSFQLPTGFFQNGSTFPSLFSSPFTGSSFNSGFNNGFATTGTGFPGFGIAPTGFNTGFGTGFNNFTNGMNQQFGFTLPSFGTGIGTGIGTGTGGTFV